MRPIEFGTDGWRAIIGRDFTAGNVRRVCEAIASVFREDHPDGGVIFVGYDTRRDAEGFARIAAETLAADGFDVRLSDAYLPTPALCWTVAHHDDAIGGVILTASHNPAEYLGVKIRMADGGASPEHMTRRVEAAIQKSPSGETGRYTLADLVGPYLHDLASLVDRDVIARADLNVVVDPLFGAARGYLASVMRDLGVSVTEIHSEEDPSFGGLHPEPIEPWVGEAAETAAQGGYDAGFITDGDSDRLGGVDILGNFVSPHLIFVLALKHLVEDLGRRGTVVRTVSGSDLIARQAERFGLELVTTPVGFKWIYEEMNRTEVLIGGEESGGIGIPSHVKERDALYIALLLLEMMAMRKANLNELVNSALEDLGALDYRRCDLSAEREAFDTLYARRDDVTDIDGKKVVSIDDRDGIKYTLEDGSWLLIRTSGTEPLMRLYVEAASPGAAEGLIEQGKALLQL